MRRANLFLVLIGLALVLLNSGCQTIGSGGGIVQVISTNPVPVEILGSHVYVPVAVNGHDLRLILDTGATHVLISPEAAGATGLKKNKEAKVVALGGTGRGSAGLAVADSITVGSALGKKIPLIITPLPPVFEADGLLGLTFLRHASFRLDYESKQLAFASPTNSAFAPRGPSVLMRLEDDLLTIPAEVDGIPVLLMLDTGANQTVTLEPWFVKKYKLRERYPQRLDGVTGLGLYGLIHGEIARLQTLKIGDHSLTNLCVEFATKPLTRQTKVAGKIGAGVFSQFTLTFDPAGKRLWLEPNARYGKDVPRPIVRSGLVCLPEGAKWIVQALIAGSPADEAGARLGDRLLQINGTPVSSLKSWEVGNAFLAPPGTHVRLRLQTGEQAPRDVTLTLRDLL